MARKVPEDSQLRPMRMNGLLPKSIVQTFREDDDVLASNLPALGRGDCTRQRFLRKVLAEAMPRDARAYYP